MYIYLKRRFKIINFFSKNEILPINEMERMINMIYYYKFIIDLD